MLLAPSGLIKPNFSDIKELKRGNKKMSKKTFKCGECGSNFSLKSSLRIHMYTHGEKPYACKVCGMKTVSHSLLNTHMRLHRDEKPFTCTLCDYRARVPAALKEHLQNHHFPGI